MTDPKAKTKKIRVKPGWEGKAFMWTGQAVGLVGKRTEFDKLKSGQAVAVPYETADYLIERGYFMEIKKAKTAKPKSNEGE